MHRLLQHWITEQAQLRSDATAVVCDGSSLTYAELDALSTKLARLLHEAFDLIRHALGHEVDGEGEEYGCEGEE